MSQKLSSVSVVIGALRPRGGGGCTLIFSCIRRLRSFFGVLNFEFQYFWGFSEKRIFFGHEDFVDIFGGHHNLGPPPRL